MRRSRRCRLHQRNHGSRFASKGVLQHNPLESGHRDGCGTCRLRAKRATSRSLFEDDGETVLRAVVKNLVILLPNEERSACDPFGCLRETHLRWVLDIFDRDRHAEMVIFPFTVLASDMENAPSVNPVGALH